MKDDKKDTNGVDQAGMLDMLEKPVADLATSRSGKSRNYDALKDADKEMLHKKVLANIQLCKKFNTGEIDEVKFFVVDDNPTSHRYSRTFKRGEQVTFSKDGAMVSDDIVEFVKTGASTKAISYNDTEKAEHSFTVAGISIKTKENGTKSINLIK